MGRHRRRAAIATAGATMLIAGLATGLSPNGSATAADAAPPVVFVLDASGSMVRETSPGVSRMDAAKQAVTSTLANLQDGTETGVLVFGTGTGNDPSEQTAGCSDVTTLSALAPVDTTTLDAAIAGIQPSGYTPISAALREAYAMLPAGEAGSVVLLSDGVDTCAPPSSCEVAAELHAQNPLIDINVVAFAVDDDEAARQQMTCIGGVGGGISSTATDLTQLTAQLRAAAGDGTALGTSGMNDITLGMTLDEVRHAIDGASVSEPSTEDGVEIIYVDCSWGRIELHDGRVYSITPTDDDVTTADGLAPGDPVSEVEALYGDPVDGGVNADGTLTYVYQLTAGGTAGYRVDADSATRSVQRIILCRCVPISAISSAYSDWQIDADGVGPLQLGMSLAAARAAAPSLGSVGTSAYWTISDAAGVWLDATFSDDRLISIRVRDPRSVSGDLSTNGVSYPSINGIRFGDSMSTVLSAYPGGMYYRNYAGGMSDYVVTDRSGHVLTFSPTGGTSSSTASFADSIRAGFLSAVTVEDATATRGSTVSTSPTASASASPTASASIEGLPSELDGEWCSSSGDECVSFPDLAEQFPNAWVHSSEASPSGVTRYVICLDADLGDSSCTTAMTMYLDYFPVGVSWDCETDGAGDFFSTCNPDYTSEHDTSQVRLVKQLNHQMEDYYADAHPLYRVD